MLTQLREHRNYYLHLKAKQRITKRRSDQAALLADCEDTGDLRVMEETELTKAVAGVQMKAMTARHLALAFGQLKLPVLPRGRTAEGMAAPPGPVPAAVAAGTTFANAELAELKVSQVRPLRPFAATAGLSAWRTRLAYTPPAAHGVRDCSRS